jgi:hypothetical protein
MRNSFDDLFLSGCTFSHFCISISGIHFTPTTQLSLLFPFDLLVCLVCLSQAMAIIFYSLFKLQLQVVLFLLFLLPSANSVSFQISRFESNASNIQYLGEAAPSDGTIEMNTLDYFARVGRATYAERVPLWDSHTGNISDFTTHFSFIIDTLGQANYSDGLAFFLAPVGFGLPPNSGGGYLGLFNFTTKNLSHNQIVWWNSIHGLTQNGILRLSMWGSTSTQLLLPFPHLGMPASTVETPLMYGSPTMLLPRI